MSTIAAVIDHTRLRPETTPAEIERLCSEAGEFGFATVCVNPCYVGLAAELLQGTRVGVCAVVGFPLGANLTGVKVREAELAIEAKATELDMVMSIGYFKAGENGRVLEDIRAVVKAADGRLVKVIIETGLLNEEEKVRATELVIAAGAGFVKTSTGFGLGGATVADVRLLAGVAKGMVGIKAAGGIRTLSQARALIAAGATRLGTSAGVMIVKEELKQNR